MAPFLQGWLAHSSTSISQCSPSNPARHSQEKLPTSSMQEPPFRQGSTGGETKNTIKQIGRQSHRLRKTKKIMVALWKNYALDISGYHHQSICLDCTCKCNSLGEQSSMSVWQLCPLYPDGHLQEKLPCVFMQWPPFLQGFFLHSLTSSLQCNPMFLTNKLIKHQCTSHIYLQTKCKHSATDEHKPCHPVGQRQVKEL